MNDFLIVTHSTLARGFVNSATLLIGKQEHLDYIDAYEDESDWTRALDEYLEKRKGTNTPLVVFSDIFGGSVNQKLVQYKQRFDFILVTGTNLAVLLEALLSTEPLTKESVQDIVNRGRDAMMVVEVPEEDIADDDFLEEG